MIEFFIYKFLNDHIQGSIRLSFIDQQKINTLNSNSLLYQKMHFFARYRSRNEIYA